MEKDRTTKVSLYKRWKLKVKMWWALRKEKKNDPYIYEE